MSPEQVEELRKAVVQTACGAEMRTIDSDTLRALESSLRVSADTIEGELLARIRKGVDKCPHVHRRDYGWGAWGCEDCKASWYSTRYDGEPSKEETTR